jgi:SP family arabinose:H+ symporter-like MFS transporter
MVISGAEQKIHSLWNLSAGMHGIVMGSALYGMVIGSLVVGWPTDRFGRRATLLWIGLLYVVSAVGTALALNVSIFISARIIRRLGIGISTVFAYGSNWLVAMLRLMFRRLA